jgi:phosphatidylglycerophosphatase C
MALPVWIAALAGYRIGLYSRKPLKQFGIAMFMGRKICPDRLSGIAADFASDIMKAGLQPGAVMQIDIDRKRNAKLILATAAPEFYANKIGDSLGFEHVLATCHITTPDGQITNLIQGENCYAAEKLRRVQGWLLQHGISRNEAHISFYSDDISDSPVLHFADQGYVVNPARKLAKAAVSANWKILDFR